MLLTAVFFTIGVGVAPAAALIHRSGVSNRGAAMYAFMLLITLTARAASFVGLTVDADPNLPGANWCWVEHAVMVKLGRQRAGRQRTMLVFVRV